MQFPFGQQVPAVLALADGTVFHGYSIGASGETSGEVVFNTSMTGYQEILTDPSYSGQIVTLTYPHIGNTGVNPEDVESRKIQAAGFIVKDVQPVISNFRATQSLPDYLKEQNIVAIAGIDTRFPGRIWPERLRQTIPMSGRKRAGSWVPVTSSLATTSIMSLHSISVSSVIFCVC